MEKFVKEASMPLVTIFDSDPSGHGYVAKFFDLPNDKVILFFPFLIEENKKLPFPFTILPSAQCNTMKNSCLCVDKCIKFCLDSNCKSLIFSN